MAELKLKDLRRDIRLPELRLPEMSRDDIAKALGEARKELREVRKDLEEFRRDFEMPRVDLTTVDMPTIDVAKVGDGARQGAKQVADGARDGAKKVAKDARKAAESTGLVKPDRLSRVPFILAGLVTLGLVSWALVNAPSVKARLREGAQRARERMAERRSAWDLDDDTRAFDAAGPTGSSAPYSNTAESTDSPFTDQPTPRSAEALGKEGDTPLAKDVPARA